MPKATDQSGDTSPSVLGAIQAERDCAAELYQAACTLMRYQSDKYCWNNLQNAAARWNAAMQFARNTELREAKQPE
jgi:hypothetical protein